MITYREAVRKAKREYLIAVLAEAGGNVSEAARIAQCGRTSFHGLIKKYVRSSGRAHRGNWGELTH